MNTVRNILAATAIAVTSFGISSGAQACSSGFLANLACNAGIIDKSTANGLDAAHAAMGRPLDHMANNAAGAAANAVVPGSGPWVTQGLELRDQYNRGAFGRPASGGRVGGGGQAIAYGNFCSTAGGRFGPGPMQPIGSLCFSSGPFGNFTGTVTQ